MIVGLGSDLVHTLRVRELIARYGDHFLEKIFLPEEVSYCRRGRMNHLSFAALIAAKEATSKALGTGWRQGLHWKLVEVLHEPSGKPTVVLHGRARERAAELQMARIHLSLSHDGDYALAQVVLESD